MTPIASDFALAFRSLRNNRVFAAASIATLALGIGAATAIFSVVNTVMLRPLPYADVDRFVIPESLALQTGDRGYITYGDFMDWRDGKLFDKVAVYQQLEMDLASSDGSPVRVNAVAVGPEFFSAAGARAARGRPFQAYDYPVNAGRAVVISDRLWRTRFGSRPDIVGLEVDVNSIRRPIVGVLSPGQDFPISADLWVPLRFATEQSPDLQRRDNFIFQGVARLAPARTLEQTNADMGGLAARVATENAAIRSNVSMVATPVLEYALGASTPRALWMLLGAVGLLLLIRWVNVANLQLARATARQRDMAVRAALGASGYRLARQTFVESLTLAAIGGTLGAVVARFVVAGIVTIAPTDVPRIAESTVSLGALAFALGVSLVVAVLFGLLPAVKAMRSAPAGVIGESSARTTAGHHSRRSRHILVAFELALSVVLLAGAGLAVRSIMHLRNANVGFDLKPVITASISFPGIRYNSAELITTFVNQLQTRLAEAPGVEAAGFVTASPMGAGGFYLGRRMIAEGKGTGPDGEVQISWSAATPGYFTALGVPLVRGRDFNIDDRTESTPVMIVNETFAKTMFPGEDAIGKRAMSSRDEKVYREIVGIVGDVKFISARDTAQSLVWVPFPQFVWRSAMITVRASGPASVAIQSVRDALGSLDPAIALANVSTMNETLQRSLAGDRLVAILLGVFATLALVLAGVGIFGVLSYTVEQRTRELGIRVALGAQARDVTRLIVRETAPMVAGGIAVGLLVAVGVSRLVSALFYGVSAADPLTFGGVSLLLALVAIGAALIPARRAARVDAMQVMRGG